MMFCVRKESRWKEKRIDPDESRDEGTNHKQGLWLVSGSATARERLTIELPRFDLCKQ